MTRRAHSAARPSALLLAALLAAAWLPACAGEGGGPRTVVLVTLDTTRADRLGAYGHARARTPNLDRLADRGLVFDRAYATTPLTLPSHASMLTGVHPAAHGLRDNTGFALSDEGRLVAEVLAERGWRTGAFVGSFVLDGRFGLDQGFETYDAPQPLTGTASAEEVMRTADVVIGAANRWIATLGPREDAFLWVHLYDPHMPYAPPSRFADLDPYDGEIAFCDEQLQSLNDALRRAGRGEPALVVTADHGEMLGEHGELTHGIFLYDGAVRVPLIIAAPGVAPGRRDEPVSITSIAPTLLDLAGLDPADVGDALPDSKAPSLVGTGTASRSGDGVVLMEALLPYYAHGWHPLRAMVFGGHKVIEGARTEAYALDDAEEEHDLSRDDPERAAEMRSLLHAALEGHAAPLGWAADAALDTEDMQRLAALGYVSLPGGGDELFDLDLPDPVARIGDLALREEALALMTQARLLGPDGVGLMRQARARLIRWRNAGSPPSPQALQLLADAEIALGDFGAAAVLLEEYLQRRPTVAQARFNLAVCRFRLGEEDRAAEEMMNAVALDPAFPEPYRWLVTDARAKGEHGAAAWWYRQLERRWRGPEDERRNLRGALQVLERDAAARGQPVAPPPGVPETLLDG